MSRWPATTDIFASGTTAATATPMPSPFNIVLTTESNVAIKAPPGGVGEWFCVFCSDSQPAVLFPDGSDDFIVGGQFAATVTIPPQSAAFFVSTGDQWLVWGTR